MTAQKARGIGLENGRTSLAYKTGRCGIVRRVTAIRETINDRSLEAGIAVKKGKALAWVWQGLISVDVSAAVAMAAIPFKGLLHAASVLAIVDIVAVQRGAEFAVPEHVNPDFT
jgi:hypothetical protein